MTFQGGEGMCRNGRRLRVEPTDEWEQIELLCGWPEQRDYELIRPLVLFGGPASERAEATGAASERTLQRRVARFEAEGMESLFGSEHARRKRLPDSMRRLIVDLKAEYPGFTRALQPRPRALQHSRGPGARGARPPRLQFRRNRLREAAPGGVPPGPAHLGRRGRGGTTCHPHRSGGGRSTGTLLQPRLARISPRPVTSDSRPVSPCSEPPTKEEDMTSTTRIPQAELTGIKGALMKRMATKMMGQVPTPLGVYWHNPKVLKASFAIGNKVQKWDQCDENLKSFAHMAVASLVGCTWCLDFNYFQAHNENLDLEKAREVPRWRESDVFTPLERDVMEYAEAMSQTPPTVTDEMSARLLEALGAPALVELTAVISFANLTTRGNVALGIESDGFAEACDLKPLAVPTARPGVASAS